MQLMLSGALYFALTYAAGFALGALRETFVTPRLGRLAATLIEMPLMLAVSFAAAQFVIRRSASLPDFSERFVIGITAFILLLAAEVVLARVLRGWSLEQWTGHFKTGEGAVSLLMFALFAVMPLLVHRL